MTIVAALTGSIFGQDDKIKVESLIGGLDQPCGIAIRPGSSDLYVAESGAARIIRVRPSEPSRSQDVVTGFAQEAFAAEPSYRLGPLSLAFLGKSHLVVGEGGQPIGRDVVRVFKLPEDDRRRSRSKRRSKRLDQFLPVPSARLGKGIFLASPPCKLRSTWQVTATTAKLGFSSRSSQEPCSALWNQSLPRGSKHRRRRPRP